MIEGFFAVEQYVPDYPSKQVMLTRRSHGRAHFHIRWGAEEEKHADLWLNALLFLRHRPLKWIEEYRHTLRQVEYALPWDDALHMLFYAVLQERATQLCYLSTARIARGESDRPELKDDADPILEQVATTVARDEVAHYSFFLAIAHVYLYYYPAQALEALMDVVRTFAMPSLNIIPNGAEFYELVHRTGVYGLRAYGRDVVRVLFDQLGIEGRRAVEDGIRRSRRVPDENGQLRDTSVFSALDYRTVEESVRRLFGRIRRYEGETGLEVDPTEFVAATPSREPREIGCGHRRGPDGVGAALVGDDPGQETPGWRVARGASSAVLQRLPVTRVVPAVGRRRVARVTAGSGTRLTSAWERRASTIPWG